MTYYLLKVSGIYHVNIQLFVTAKFDQHPDPHWFLAPWIRIRTEVKSLIWIRIETNTDLKHRLKLKIDKNNKQFSHIVHVKENLSSIQDRSSL